MLNDPSSRPAAAEDPEPPAPDSPADPALARFTTCRWHKPAEGGQPAHCVQREVLSMAGIHGFNPESWCADCNYFKVRRVPRKPSL